MQQINKGRVSFYGHGGCGTNIGSQLEHFRERGEKSFADLTLTYVDTSRSNLAKSIDPRHCYLIDGLDGSGKVRAENHEVITQHIPVLMQQHPAQDLAIVVHSLGGGSGSVSGPLHVSKLIEAGIPTIVIGVASADTKIEASNSLKTLKSYYSIAGMHDEPLVLAPIMNYADKSREESDGAVVRLVLALCALFSRENEELDSKDLTHLLKFNKTTSFGAQLAALTLVEAGGTIADLGNVISVATLAKRGDRTALPVPTEYQTVGYLADDADEKLRKRAPLHFIISDGVLGDIAKDLQSIVARFDAASGIRQTQSNLLGKNDKAADNGLVL